jgi:hypothetical protein
MWHNVFHGCRQLSLPNLFATRSVFLFDRLRYVTFSPPSGAPLPGAVVSFAVIGSPASSVALTCSGESLASRTGNRQDLRGQQRQDDAVLIGGPGGAILAQSWRGVREHRLIDDGSGRGVDSASEWVAAWVSTPMTNVYCSVTMGIATEFLPIGDVVSASARKELRGRPVTGHDSRQRVGQASNQATEARPGRRRRPRPSGQIPGRAPRTGARRFTSHTQPGRRHRSCQPAPGQP